MIERIQLLMKIHQMSAADLADKLGTERSGISHFLSGRNKPSLAFITKLLEKFPDVSPDWLVMGSGPMMRGDQNALPLDAEKNMNSSPAKEPVGQMTIDQANTKHPVANDEEPAPYNSITTKAERPVKQESKSNLTPLPVSNSGDIERIVIFYNDHSFSEYKMR